MSDLNQTTSNTQYNGGVSHEVDFGGKSNASAAETESDNTASGLGKHEDTAPYSGIRKHASGTVGGAGFGNKVTEGFNRNDSTIGKMMEKTGSILHSKHVASAGTERRRSAGYVEEPEMPKE